MFLVHNERTKLTAAWLNTLATALVAAGSFGPFAAQLYGIGGINGDAGYLGLLAGCGFLGGVALHLGGWLMLGRLRE